MGLAPSPAQGRRLRRDGEGGAGPRGAARRREVDGFFREMLLKGVDEVGLTIGLLAEIEGFERRHHAANAWAAR